MNYTEMKSARHRRREKERPTKREAASESDREGD